DWSSDVCSSDLAGQYYFQYDPVTGQQGAERTLWEAKDARKGYWKVGSNITNSIQFAGGNERGSFRASLTHLKNEWIMPNTGFERINVSTKADYEIAKGVRLNSSINYSNRS